MKIMKLLASCAMVGALTAVCASGAFADKPIPVVDYVTEGEGAPYIEVAVPTEYVATGDYTVLVLNADVDDESRKGEDENGVAYNNVGKVTNADITQIDQWDGKTAIKLAVNTLADGTYYVRVGGAAPTEDNANGYIDTTFTVGSTGGEDVPETFCKMIGDFNADDDVTSTDVTFMLRCLAGLYEDYEDVDYAAAGYANGDEDLTSSDVTEVKRALAGIGGDNIWYYADFYYDEADEMYYVTGEIHEEMCE